jgi:CO/xanthine dehydrogenase Mo-binding subunit
LNVERKHVRSANGKFFDRRAPEEMNVTLAELAVWAHQRGMPLRAEVLHELPPLEWQFELGQGEAYYCYGFSAHVAEVTVDEDTGKVMIDRITAVIDTGRTVNPDAVLGQIYGGAVMGSGYAVLEELGLEAGRVGNQNFDEYLLPTAADIGEIRADWVEAPAAQGPFGAKGIAELVVVGVAPAVLSAINHAKGSDISEVPANLERVFLGYALRKH